MKIIVCKNYEEMSEKSADFVAAQIKANPSSVLGLATGSTPEGMYADLVKLYKNGEVSFRSITSVNLDEYYPISPENEQSYRYFMNSRLFDSVDINKAKTFVPDGSAKNPEAECLRYDALVDSLGGIDLQVLGIGRNGHIGFNEPSNKLTLGTHITELTESTVSANSRFFESADAVPKRAMTMGIGTIFKAKKILLMAAGVEKKAAVKRLLDGVVDTACPATLLKLHPDVTLICTSDIIPEKTVGGQI